MRLIKYNLKNRKRINELFLVSGNHVVDLITTLLVTKLVSVYLSKSEYGFYALILSIFALVSIFPFTSLHTAIERYIIEYKSKNTFEKNFSSLISIHSIFFLFYFFLLIFAKSYLSVSWRNILILFCFFIVTRIYKALIVCIWNVEKKRLIMLVARLVDMILQIGVIVYFIISDSLIVESVLLASVIGNTVSIIFFAFSERKLFFLHNLNIETFRRVFVEILKYSLPLIFWGLFLWAQNMIGRWYVDYFLNKSDVANYSMMTSLALLPSTAIVAIVGQFIVPIAYANENDNPGYIALMNKKIQLVSVFLWAFIIFLTFLLKDFMIKLLLDAKYTDVSWSLPYLMFGTAIYSIGQISIYEIYYYKNPKFLILSNILPGILSIFAGYFLIQKFGFKGAIVTNVISFVISGVITLVSTAIFTKKRVNLIE